MRCIKVLIALFFCCAIEAQDIKTNLSKIPSKDKERIEKLFAFFIRRDSLGYVLFGDTKVVCATGIPLTCKESVTPPSWADNPIYFQKELKLCWETWSQYSYLFKHPNILVCEEFKSLAGGIYLELIFINKRNLRALLEKHQSDFREVLGDEFSVETFIAKIEKMKNLRSLIHHDEKLFGLLLGFGLESSTAFREMLHNEKLNDSLGRVAYRPEGCCITPVCFRGNPNSEEVKKLVDIYTQEILEIEKQYKREDFLVTVLESFCSQHSE